MTAYRMLEAAERQVDALLARPCVLPEAAGALARAARRWSGAVWSIAEAAGPIDLDALDIERGMGLAARPVFVCGVHRSGTTLVRDLLDGHPALVVLPSEGSYLTGFETRLSRVGARARLECLGTEWIRRLANPIHREPYWVLGRSSAVYSAYVQFARALAAWWPRVEAGIGAVAASWPLAAVALAYARCARSRGPHSCAPLERAPARWVEKTPTNERFLPRLRAEFPRAKVIQLVRHPCAVYASHVQMWRNVGRRFPDPGRVLGDLAQSYAVALEQQGRGRGDHLLIRYEDLLRAPAGMLDRLAGFLGLEPLDILSRPTVAGVPAAPNSSFVSGAEAGRVRPDHDHWIGLLRRAERARIAAAVGESARALGYEVPAPITRFRPATWLMRMRRPLGTGEI